MKTCVLVYRVDSGPFELASFRGLWQDCWRRRGGIRCAGPGNQSPLEISPWSRCGDERDVRNQHRGRMGTDLPTLDPPPT